MIVEIVVLVLVLLGTIITLISSLGVLRLPDVYTRAHATTKSATLGILCILLGAFIHFMYVHHIVSIRLLLGIVFVFLTAPIAGHMIIRSAHRTGVPLAEISVGDALKEDLEKAAGNTGAAETAGVIGTAGTDETAGSAGISETAESANSAGNEASAPSAADLRRPQQPGRS